MEMVQVSNNPDGTTLITINRPARKNAICAITARELQQAFVERYFQSVPQIWEERTSDSAQTIVQGLYPALLIDQTTVDRTDAFLAENSDLAFGARRLVAEGADGVRRALRARAADRNQS